jgi:hypothetical protein
MTPARLMLYAKCSENTTVLETAQNQTKARKSARKQGGCKSHSMDSLLLSKRHWIRDHRRNVKDCNWRKPNQKNLTLTVMTKHI